MQSAAPVLGRDRPWWLERAERRLAQFRRSESDAGGLGAGAQPLVPHGEHEVVGSQDERAGRMNRSRVPAPCRPGPASWPTAACGPCPARATRLPEARHGLRCSSVRDRIRSDLSAAMRARDSVAVAALRSALAALENAEAVPDVPSSPARAMHSAVAGAFVGRGLAEIPRRVLSAHGEEAVLRAEIDDREAAAAVYQQSGARERAARLRAEASLLAGYLP